MADAAEVRVPVVCLVGSSRFKQDFQEVGERLEKAGTLVLAMSFFQHADGVPVSDEERAVLERVDQKRIDLADEVMVLNVRRLFCSVCKTWVEDVCNETCVCEDEVRLNVWQKRQRYVATPYVGESTAKEIAYAASRGKAVSYLNPIS